MFGHFLKTSSLLRGGWNYMSMLLGIFLFGWISCCKAWNVRQPVKGDTTVPSVFNFKSAKKQTWCEMCHFQCSVKLEQVYHENLLKIFCTKAERDNKCSRNSHFRHTSSRPSDLCRITVVILLIISFRKCCWFIDCDLKVQCVTFSWKGSIGRNWI